MTVCTYARTDPFRLPPGYYLIWYDYTGRGQLKTIYGGAGSSDPWYRYTYDLNGNLLKRQNQHWGDSINIGEYDALNRPGVWEQTQSWDNAFARSHFQYDSLSRLTASWRDEQSAKGERFGYDAIGQLTSVAYNADQVWTGNPLNATRTVNYNLDPLNRTGPAGVTDNGVQTSFASNAMNQYTGFGTQPPNYTANFNLWWINGWDYGYDAEKRLTSAKIYGASTPRAEFVYDGLGRCVKRTIDGAVTLLTYDGWNPIVEWDAAGNFAAWNVYGAGADEILSRYTPGGGELRYHADRQGSVFVLLDQNGSAVEKYTYDAFGQPTITDWNGNVRSQSAYGNRFMFTGREWLAPLGLYDYRNRMYQPQLGRFLQPDPLGFAAGDANLFRYCAGDPVNRTDPSGLSWAWLTKIFQKRDTAAGNSVTTTSGYVPTGSNIPEMRTATWNGSTWDVTYRDSIHGTTSIGSFALVSGGGFSGSDGGARFVPAVSISAGTVIRGGDQAGIKSLQTVLLTPSGTIAVQPTYTGSSNILNIGSVRGLFFPRQSVSGTSVTLSGTAYSTAILGTGFVAGGLFGGLAAADFAIDYRFTVSVNFSARQATVTGSHDGYPSYYVTVNGSFLYNFNERSFGDLRHPMEVHVNESGYW